MPLSLPWKSRIASAELGLIHQPAIELPPQRQPHALPANHHHDKEACYLSGKMCDLGKVNKPI